MIAPTHRQLQPSASELFTDREDARALFDTALDEPQASESYRVVVWYGVGGQGKTALQGEFGRMLQRRSDSARRVSAPRTGHAIVDFRLDSERDIAQALLSIRLQLAHTGGSSFFPAFDVAFARYFALTQPGKDIKAVHGKLFETGSAVLDDVLQAAASMADSIPGVALFSVTAQVGDRILRCVRNRLGSPAKSIRNLGRRWPSRQRGSDEGRPDAR